KLFTEGGHPKLKSRQIPDPEKSKRKADGSWGKIIQMDYHVLDLRAPAVQKRSQE
ncbi:MAG: hypothetical protein GWN89_04120, partial [Thermoplasmata archaeon]|nr:hypothetical protein [Thermoplasmata archaeon]NIS19134.1 hypothetical protein [Thermoplasmata archaeon]NIT76190.1 hypothetical protein [Thermoplasmata archaeon]NIY02561.1 hypothetical protein [Thermoplasmata archaeon]